MKTQAKINGENQDIIITNAYEDSDFFKKMKKHYPHSVLEYLAVNGYEFDKIEEYITNNNNISMSYEIFKPTKSDKYFKILSKFKIEGIVLKNLNAKNTNDKSIHLELGILKLNKEIINRVNYPFYAIVTLKKNTSEDKVTQEFSAIAIEFLEAVTIDIEEYKSLRKDYSLQEWLNLIFNTIGYDADTLTPFEKYSFLVRLIPFCFEQYHSIELGNKETAKSYFYSIMPGIYSTSISAGDISMANFVNNNKTNTPGILQTTNVVNFDEVTDISLKDKGIINVLQSYLQDGQANRGNDDFHGKASIAFTGNITDFERHVLNKKSLFSLFKEDINNETIFDKLHFFLPGWKFTKINPNKYAKKESKKIRRDYFLSTLSFFREEYLNYLEVFNKRIKFTSTESGRDMRIDATIAGLIMLLCPDKIVSDEELEAFAYIALTGRKTLLRDLEIINDREYVNSLQVKNIEVEKEIRFDDLSNFIINISKSLLESHNIRLENIDYYYLDYYKDYAITKEINKQYGFEIIEPTIVIKCTGKPHLYKLALSSYGISMNILEVSEGKNKKNVVCRKLTDDFVLIETNEIKDNIKKLNFKIITKPVSNSVEQLKEKYKDQPFVTDIIDILTVNQENQFNLSNLIKSFENKIEIQNNQLLENKNIIKKLNIASSIKDISNIILFSHSDTLYHFYDLRNILVDKITDNINSNRTTTVNKSECCLGAKVYRDSYGKYKLIYESMDDDDKVEIIGKEYIKDKYQESLDYGKKGIFPTLYFSKKDEYVDSTLEKYIKIIDNILDYSEKNSLIEFGTINLQTDLETITLFMKNLELYISSLTSFIEYFDSIKKLLNNLEQKVDSYTSLEKNKISIYLKLLVDLYETTKVYITTYLIPDNLDNTLSQLPDQSFDDRCFSETIFDNKFISDLKKSQN